MTKEQQQKKNTFTTLHSKSKRYLKKKLLCRKVEEGKVRPLTHPPLSQKKKKNTIEDRLLSLVA